MESPENPKNSPPATTSPWPAKHLPLASLSPKSSESELSYLLAVVTLLWPFSPSSSSLSFLACEKDFRLRLSKGQLHVNVQGSAALELESKKLQIGDEVMISLEGALFKDLENPTARDVPWSITFSNRLAMKVKTNSGWSTVDIETPNAPEATLSSSHSERAVTPDAAALSRPSYGLSQDENSWSTPGAFKRQTAFLPQESSSPFGLHTLFGDGGFDLERRRKKPRFSNSFRLVDDYDNPHKTRARGKTMGSDESHDGTNKDREKASLEGSVTEGDEPESLQGRESEESANICMPPPPPLPSLKPNMHDDEFSPEVPDSPSLDPIPSPQLPMVSPFLGHGLSSADYLSVNFALSAHELPGASQIFQQRKEKEKKEFSLTSAFSGFSQGLKMPLPVQGESSTNVQAATPERRPMPGSFDSKKLGATATGETYMFDDEKPSDGESERDSLFDELSDVEGVCRARSRSPLRRTLESEKMLHLKSAVKPRPSKLNITTPSHVREDREGPLYTPQSARHPKTPFLYLPTPSPRTEKQSEIPQSAPPKFILRPEGNTSPTRRRSSLLFGNDTESTPHELSDYFGRPKWQKPQVAERQSLSRALTQNDAESRDSLGDGSVPSSLSASKEKSNVQNSLDSSDSSSDGFEPGLTTDLSDFPPLCSLKWGAVVDMIGVVSRYKEMGKAKGGQKDFYISMRIVDPSRPIGITVNVFRPYEEALPVVNFGDVVLLRSFKISSQRHNLVATSTATSAWAVWKNHGRNRPANIPGPPVEFGELEQKYVRDLGNWYEQLDESTKEELRRGPESSEEVDNQ